MSLDVYLELEGIQTLASDRLIPIRDDGQNTLITRDEWDRRFPGRTPHTISQSPDTITVYEANITHNLNSMADEVGIYKHLWRPDEIGIDKAEQLIAPLREGLARLQADPERCKKLNPANGWGTYELLVSFVREYLAACQEYPDATVRVWR